MKKTKILYWIFTILFAGLMLPMAIQNIMLTEDSIKLITGMGYPLYFVRFIGIAKTLGVIAILIPGFPRIKEWAYAGLFFDLTGVIYSALSLGGFDPKMLWMLMWIIPGILSYYYYHKMNKTLYIETSK